jgi:hypothetical protein
MHDDGAKMPQTHQERAPWVQPAFARIEAGSAELLTGSVDDGPGDES